MPLITLTTDFGIKDPDLGYIKSRILQAIPDAQILDISHDLMPFDPQEAVYVIENSLRDFPKNTIHLIGFDSESSESQQPVLVVANGQYYLGNNNGVITTALASQKADYYILPVSGDEAFMQAHILATKQLVEGKRPDQVGQKVAELKTIMLPKPFVKHNERTGEVSLIAPQVIYNDHYGNAVFNLKKATFEAWQKGRKFVIKFGHNEINYLVENYHDAVKHEKSVTVAGQMFAHFNSFGYFEIFVYQSNKLSGGANTLLGLQKNQTVHIVFET